MNQLRKFEDYEDAFKFFEVSVMLEDNIGEIPLHTINLLGKIEELQDYFEAQADLFQKLLKKSYH